MYTPFDEMYSKRIILKSVTDSEDPPQNAPKEYSPERNMWKAVVDPDTSKPGPWNTSIYFGSDSNEEVWKLTLVDQIGVGIKWTNEKLVFGQVWWGKNLCDRVHLGSAAAQVHLQRDGQLRGDDRTLRVVT